jgi:16S rRNA (guanine527-N7)-methyltransferase
VWRISGRTLSQSSDGSLAGRFSLADLSLGLRGCLLEAQRVGAIGPASLEQHLLHSLGFADVIAGLVPNGGSVVDLGSGGGIPGLVLAEVLPSLSIVLLEGRTMRCELLSQSIETLDLSDRVSVLSSRAELVGQQPQWRGRFDAVVARGFAAPAVTAECAAPLLRDGGILCVSEPPASLPFERWPVDGCAELGLQPALSVETPNSFVVLRQVMPCPLRYPRRVGVPAKRPLF